MKNKKLLGLVQKLQIDSDDSEGISNLSLQLSSQVSGGRNFRPNDQCYNITCTTGVNESCTNNECSGDMTNLGCTNISCS